MGYLLQSIWLEKDTRPFTQNIPAKIQKLPGAHSITFIGLMMPNLKEIAQKIRAAHAAGTPFAIPCMRFRDMDALIAMLAE